MRILLLSDSGLNVDKGGFPQTLYNIFSFAKPADFLFITSVQAYKIAPSSQPFAGRTITYNTQLIPYQNNRLGKYINKYINGFNYSVNQRLNRFRKIKTIIKQFDPSVVITASNGAEGVFMHYRLKPAFENKKVFPYFMDDWLCQTQLTWNGGSIQALAKKLLSDSNDWLMISESLANIFKERYLLTPKRILEIHNPVDTSEISMPLPVHKKQEYTIAYAGALWPMHFDAFLIMAKATQLLQEKRKIKLVLYTAESNWEWRKDKLKDMDVMYEGFISYKNIHQKLGEADCLLVTSSFASEWQTHSKGSVQTKMTDYMKAGRLIIACGPAYAANHQFIKKYDCGICIETDDVQQAASKLDAIINDMPANNKYIINAFEALKNSFSFEKVHQNLKDFLAA